MKGTLDAGCFDFMFATAWKVAWAISDERTAMTTIVSAYDFGNWFSNDPWEIYESWPHRLVEEIKRRLRMADGR
jgi:hypothetical protein